MVQPAIPVPTTFKGRTVTPRGVHMQPSGQWGQFMAHADEWIARLHAMHVSYVVALADSDSFAAQGAADVLLGAGIIPIVRFNQSRLPTHFTHQAATEQLTSIYARHGAPLFVQYLNEPGNSREWVNNIVPPDWWDVWTSRWREGARQIIERGAMSVLPDGPCFPRSPFPDCSQGLEQYFESGWIAYGGHYYGLNRPVDYPYDDASRFGTPMTEVEYLASLDDFADDPAWHDPPLDVLNAERARLADPHKTALDDDTCWRGWEQVQAWMDRDLGYQIPHLMTEGGWTPKARAGSGPDAELRYTLPTPCKVAARTLAMEQVEHPLLATCPWLIAAWPDLDGSGWYDDRWFGGAYYDLYGWEKPVAAALAANPPGPPQPPDPLRALLVGARGDVAEADAALAWV